MDFLKKGAEAFEKSQGGNSQQNQGGDNQQNQGGDNQQNNQQQGGNNQQQGGDNQQQGGNASQGDAMQKNFQKGRQSSNLTI